MKFWLLIAVSFTLFAIGFQAEAAGYLWTAKGFGVGSLTISIGLIAAQLRGKL